MKFWIKWAIAGMLLSFIFNLLAFISDPSWHQAADSWKEWLISILAFGIVFGLIGWVISKIDYEVIIKRREKKK